MLLGWLWEVFKWNCREQQENTAARVGVAALNTTLDLAWASELSALGVSASASWQQPFLSPPTPMKSCFCMI